MKTAKLTSLLLLFTLALLCAPETVWSAKYAGEAFTLGAGARGLGMGGAVVAGPFDGTAPYWNPAGMNALGGRYITAMHAETFGTLLNHDFVSYVHSRPDSESRIKAYGFYLYYLGGGGIKITRLNEFDRPIVVSEESHGDWLFSAAISGKIKNKIDFGLTAKIIYRDIGTESGYGLTLDAGATYQAHPYLNLGLMVTDITSGFIRYSGKSEIYDESGNLVERDANTEAIYPTVKPGFLFEYTYRDFTGRLAGSGDIRFEGIKSAAEFWLGDISLDTHWGAELDYREMVFGRAGVDIGRFTAGAGLIFQGFSLDFAYLHQDDFDETYRVSVGYQF